MKPAFFETPADFRRWLKENHASETELWVGFYKKSTGKPTITWPEAVDQALCFGWIDGVRKTLDAESYTNRFTPRRRGSNWSLVNRSEEHTSELQSQSNLVCRLLLEKKKNKIYTHLHDTLLHPCNT